MNNIFVLWSGGLDSTYLIYKYLNLGYNVFAGHIQIDNNSDQTKREIETIEKLNKIFYEMFPGQWNYQGIIYSIMINRINNALLLKQAPLFILSSLYVKYDYDELCIGYVMNDDAISWIPDFEKTYYSYQPFFNNKLPKISFQLMKLKKEEIIRQLPSNLLELVTYCEGDKDKCGICPSCIRHNALIPEKIQLTETKEKESTDVSNN